MNSKYTFDYKWRLDCDMGIPSIREFLFTDVVLKNINSLEPIYS